MRSAYFLFDDLNASGQLKSLHKITFSEHDLQLPFHHTVLVPRINVLLAALWGCKGKRKDKKRREEKRREGGIGRIENHVTEEMKVMKEGKTLQILVLKEDRMNMI